MAPEAPGRDGRSRAHDRLELELRKVEGVIFVAFSFRDGATIVELGSTADDVESVKLEALRLTLEQLSGPVEIDVLDHAAASGTGEAPGAGDAELRVELLVTPTLSARGQVEIHLTYRGRRVSVSARSIRPGPSGGRADAGAEQAAETGAARRGVADAVLAGLALLDLPVPFTVEAVHRLSGELGAGTLVVLRNTRTGDVYRGLAGGPSSEDSIARAVLNALNRFLDNPLAPRLSHA